MAKTNLSKLQENFTCLAIVCVDHIKLPLMDILENHIKPPDLYYEVNSSTLISANKLRPDQKKLCYITPPGIPDYSKFDVTLLYTLIRNLCPSLKPSGRWGEEPAAWHTQLGDDIERLRLFRNEQFAHANSAEISDGEFNKLWTDLQTVINRIQSNKKAGCKTDYLQTFKSIEKRLLNWDDLEKYKLLLEATIHASKQREDMDGPDIWIEGSEEAVCGSTAHFQANVKERKVSFLSVSWKKLIKNESTPIDTSNKKFWGKTNKELFIESVCKEDEGEYQAVLSFEEDRIGTTIKSNVIFLRVVGGIPTVTTSHETCLQTHSVKLIGNVFVIDGLPVIDEIYWTKNGNKIYTQVNEGKYSKVSVDTPLLTIYNVNQYDAGHYTLTATNAAGTTVSDTIVLGAPDIVLGESKEESDGSQIFTVTITSIPAAYNIQWQVSENNSDMFTTLDENAEEYRGTSHSVPHPVLVVRLKEHLKNNMYQIEVQNFVGGRRKKIPSILNIFYKDRGAGVMFAKLFNEIVELFPERKLNQLQDLTIDSCKDKDKDLPPLIKTATSAREYFRILKDKELFTPSDVIFMQFLLRESNCGLLNDKCIAYAKTQKALCFYEEPPRNGYKKVQFHVQGNISNYTTDQIGIIKETVVAIVGCDSEDIHLDGFLNSDSFFVVLSMKERYVNGLFNMNQQDKEKLVNLNIDYFIIDSDHIYLKNPKDIIQRIENLKMEDEAWELLKSNLRDLEEPKNVLLVGSFGVGKSSFINTVITALTGKYDYYADVGSGSRHNTTRIKRISSINYWRPKDEVDKELKLPTFIDMIGLDPQLSTSEDDRTINSQILNLVINGQLPENADLLDLGKKLKEGKLVIESTDAKTSPVDAIIAVVSAENLNGAIPHTLIDEIYMEANMRNKQIPVFAVVTKIDKCDLTQQNLERKKNELCEAINITPDKLLLCSNYQPDPEQDIEKDIDILKFLIKVCSPHLQAVELEKIECEAPPPIPALAALYNTILDDRYTYIRVQALKVAVAVLVVAFFLSLIMNLWNKMKSYTAS